MQKKLKTTQTPAAPASKPAEESKNSLTEFQVLLTDLFSDWLLNGTTSEYSEALLMTFGKMQWARMFQWQHERPKGETNAAENAKRVYDDWQRKLVAGWPADTAKTEAAAPAPASITEYIRTNMRGEVGRKFEDFRNSASPEEIAFMDGVLANRESSNLSPTGDRAQEIYIATAFQTALEGLRDVYLKVPEKLVPLIREIVDDRARRAA